MHFWATWCGVCRAEQGTIDALAGDHHVVTVASQSGGAPEVRAYLEREGVDFPVLVDPGGALAARWGVHAFPTTFVVAPDGGGPATYVDDGETGILTATWDVARLASALDEAVTSVRAEPDGRRAERSRAVVRERFTVQRMAEALGGVYRTVARDEAGLLESADRAR